MLPSPLEGVTANVLLVLTPRTGNMLWPKDPGPDRSGCELYRISLVSLRAGSKVRLPGSAIEMP